MVSPDIRTANNGRLEGDLLPRVTILGEHEGRPLAMVPMELIYREDVPVDDKHVAELAESIRSEAGKGQGTGQLSPILLAEVPGEPMFRIADGFHRDAALHVNGSPEVFASIRRNTSFEELLDLRILTANTHGTVSFSRVVEWVSDAWDRGPWAEKITILQAFGLVQAAATGKNLGLIAEEVAEIREWVVDKSKKWNMAPTTVRANLAIAESADPDLVKLVRQGKPGLSSEGKQARYVFTRQHLGAIAEGLSGPEFYSRQRLLADLAVKQRLSVLAIERVANRIRPSQNLADAVKVVNAIDWAALKLSTANGRPNPAGVVESKRRTIRTPAQEPAPVFRPEGLADVTMSRELVLGELELGRSALEAIVLKGKYSPRDRISSIGRLVVVPETEREISQLLQPVDIEMNRQNLTLMTERAMPRILTMLGDKHNMHGRNGESVVDAAVEWIEGDLQYGDLRFVQIEKDSVAHELLANSMRLELERRKNNFQRRGPLAKNLDVVSDVSQVNLESLLTALPRMDRQGRRALLYHGMLGLTLPTTALLLGQKTDVFSRLVQTTRAKITAGTGRAA